jgi:transposase InsO family protein
MSPVKGSYNGVYMNYSFIPLSAQRAASLPKLSLSAKKRLNWMDHYHKYKNAALTCRHFGISRKTFHHWKNRYQPFHLESLEEKSRRPKKTRQWQVSILQESKILKLRRKYLRYGKEKLRILYQQEYKEPISSWKIQRVIQKHNLYYSPVKTLRLRKKRRANQPKLRITALKKQSHEGFLIQTDTIVLHWPYGKRYILTGIDHYSKIAFARMYKSKHSKYAADFLRRLHYLFDGKIENIQTDNGSEFAKHFRDAITDLNLNHYFSRIKTPQDNAFDERFNRTLQEEFIALGNRHPDINIFNQKLTEWLVEYNFKRPHQSLGYETPINFQNHYFKLLPMYPSSTLFIANML